MSKIEWTDRSDWNPMRGCTRVSDGCKNCYAERIAGRFSGPGQPFEGFATVKGREARWTGKVALIEDRLTLPLRWRKPSRIFVNSAFDLFHESVPDDWIDKVFAVMALAPQHTFQVLTKRPKRTREYFAARTEGDPWAEAADEIGDLLGMTEHPRVLEPRDMPLPSVWLGVSAEDQTRADERIPYLLATPAAVRWVSYEPALGPIDFSPWLQHWRGALSSYNDGAIRRADIDGLPVDALDWIVCGGESGPGARPMHPDWARKVRDDCAAAGVAYFFKQWGEWAPGENSNGPPTRTEQTADWFDGRWHYGEVTPKTSGEMHFDDAPDLYRLGKKTAGRLLDGIEHNAMPEASR